MRRFLWTADGQKIDTPPVKVFYVRNIVELYSKELFCIVTFEETAHMHNTEHFILGISLMQNGVKEYEGSVSVEFRVRNITIFANL